MHIPDSGAQSAPSRYELTSAAKELYAEIAAQSAGTSQGILQGEPPDPRDPDLRQLVSMGLVVEATGAAGRYLAVNPKVVGTQLGLTLHTEAMATLALASRLPKVLQHLQDPYEQGRLRTESGGSVTYVSGLDAINATLERLLTGCTEELLTAQPGGARPADILESALPRDLAALRKGVRMHVLYYSSARYDANTREYVQMVTAEGCEVRTLDEPFPRMIIVDRKKAVIPVLHGDLATAPTYVQALLIEDPAVARYIQHTFERDWRRALAWNGDHAVQLSPQIANAQNQEIIRCLMDELTNEAAARQLGVSSRTYAKKVGAIKEELGVNTLFLAGYRWREAEELARQVQDKQMSTEGDMAPE